MVSVKHTGAEAVSAGAPAKLIIVSLQEAGIISGKERMGPFR